MQALIQDRFSLSLLDHQELLLDNAACKIHGLPPIITNSYASISSTSISMSSLSSGASSSPGSASSSAAGGASLGSNNNIFISSRTSFSQSDNPVAVVGRLWICTKSFFFSPKDYKVPIVRFPFSDIDTTPSAIQNQTNIFSFSFKRCVLMKPRNEDVPYIYLNITSSNVAPGSSSSIVQSKGDDKITIRIQLLHAELSPLLLLSEQLWAMNKTHDESEKKSILQSITNPRLMVQFDKSRLVDFREKILTLGGTHHLISANNVIQVEKIEPLASMPGCLFLTNQRIYFQPAQINNIGKKPCEHFDFTGIKRVFKRRYLLEPRGLEIIFDSEKYNTLSNGFGNEPALFLAFIGNDAQAIRDQVFDCLIHNCKVDISSLTQSPELLAKYLEKWQKREISNFEYLSFLNSCADRSTNDLTQYPVFPWVIQDFKSSKLDLSNPLTFRDLSKPIGALNPTRLASFKERFRNMEPDMDPPPFLYGTHYSTPGYVLYFLVRQHPDLMLKLQNGKFDQADRLFDEISETWNSVFNNPADLKELIPEFYDTSAPEVGSFLLNSKQLDLGRRQNGQRVADVKLPPWSKSPQDFIEKMRNALESDYVSENLHLWIDLIFGCKQRGKAAIEADNLFYHLTYENNIPVSKNPRDSVIERDSIVTQIYEFGQTPRQLFLHPHQARNATPSNSNTVLPLSIPITRVPDTVNSSSRDDHRDERGDSTSLSTSSPPSLSPFTRPVTTKPKAPNRSNYWAYLTNGRSKEKSFHISTARLRAHGDAVMDICFSQYGGNYRSNEQYLYTVSKDATMTFISLNDPSNPRITRRIKLGKLALSCCQVLFPSEFSTSLDSNMPKLLTVGSWDNCLYLYSIEFGRVIDKINAHDDAISCITQSSYSSSSRLLVTGSWDSSVKVWQNSYNGNANGSLKPLMSLYDHSEEVSAVSLSEDENLILSGSRNGQIYLNDLRVNGQAVRSFNGNECFGDKSHGLGTPSRPSTGHSSRVTKIEWLSSGSRFLCCSGGIVKLYDLSLNSVVAESKFTKGIHSPSFPIGGFCTDGNGIMIAEDGVAGRVILGDAQGISDIWDSTTNLSMFDHGSSISAIAASMNGKTFATAGYDGSVKIGHVTNP